MVTPNTPRQQARKLNWQQSLNLWGSLTVAQRTAWDAYAGAFPVPSHNNPAAYLSGFNLFTRWHSIWLTANSGSLPNPSGAQGTVVITLIEIIRSGATLLIDWGLVTTNGPWSFELYLSRPLSATKSYAKGWTKFIAQVVAGSDITAAYNAIFGLTPTVGQYIAIDFTCINQTNGQVIYAPSAVIQVTV